MLTAYTKDGKKLCLGNHYKKESLLYFRSREKFHCPACGEPVILKLGDKKIYHFSHLKGGSCQDYFEGETEYHLQGKKQLYQWLRKQKIIAELEYYIKEIRQRPDIMFLLNGQRYALEFQCSQISQEAVYKRTQSYLSNHYIPIWILGAMHFHRKNQHSVVLSKFQYLFLQKKNSEWTIPYYCPENRLFIQTNCLHPYSSKNTIANTSIRKEEKMTLNSLLAPSHSFHLPLNEWKRAIQTVKQNFVHYHNAKSLSFIHEMYQNHLNLFLLPPVLGLPIKDAPYIETSPIVWQSYLYLDYIRHKRPGEILTLAAANQTIQNRIKRKDVALRFLPQAGHSDFRSAVFHYMETLTAIGLLTRKKMGFYQLNKSLEIPNSMCEQQDMENTFYHNYWGIIEKELESRA